MTKYNLQDFKNWLKADKKREEGEYWPTMFEQIEDPNNVGGLDAFLERTNDYYWFSYPTYDKCHQIMQKWKQEVDQRERERERERQTAK